jgi:hypothetical protein
MFHGPMVIAHPPCKVKAWRGPPGLPSMASGFPSMRSAGIGGRDIPSHYLQLYFLARSA